MNLAVVCEGHDSMGHDVSLYLQINKMELQQQHQQQQFFDGYFEGSGTAKTLLSKVLSLAVSLFAIVLVVVSLCAKTISPFISTW